MGSYDGRRGEEAAGWRFGPNPALSTFKSLSVRGVLEVIVSYVGSSNTGTVIHLGKGDPSFYPSFQTSYAAESAVVSALRSRAFNGYPPAVGLLDARRAVAEYLSGDLPYQISPESVFLTAGCHNSIEIILSVLARPNANVLLPRPGYPYYESRVALTGMEFRHYDLLPDKRWEIDLDAVEALVDDNTVAMVVINPGNPCGNVFTHSHLAMVAETARKLGILVIADEVYAYLTFGRNPFVSMCLFSDVVPVITLGALSKRWIVPGWRLGWIVTNDPHGILRKTKIIDCMKDIMCVTTDPATFVQAAVPEIIHNTESEFFSKILALLKETSETCVEALEEIDCITCPNKPEGSMAVMVKLDLMRLDGIRDDFDFCCKLAKEESLIILPGSAVGMSNWLRIIFAVEPSLLREGLDRLKSFCRRHGRDLAI